MYNILQEVLKKTKDLSSSFFFCQPFNIALGKSLNLAVPHLLNLSNG